MVAALTSHGEGRVAGRSGYHERRIVDAVGPVVGERLPGLGVAAHPQGMVAAGDDVERTVGTAGLRDSPYGRSPRKDPAQAGEASISRLSHPQRMVRTFNAESLWRRRRNGSALPGCGQPAVRCGPSGGALEDFSLWPA